MIYTGEKKRKTPLDKVNVIVDGKEYTLDSETWYFACATDNDSEDKKLRKILKLPVTKKLVYYKEAQYAESKVNILRFRIIEVYEVTDFWAKLEIETEEHQYITIVDAFLSEMQLPSFVDDMAKSR